MKWWVIWSIDHLLFIIWLGRGKTPSSLQTTRDAKSKRRMKTEGSKMDLGLGWRPWKRQLPLAWLFECLEPESKGLIGRSGTGRAAGREEEEEGWGRTNNARQSNDPRRCSAACHVGSYLTDSTSVWMCCSARVRTSKSSIRGIHRIGNLGWQQLLLL
jgi:hypothetical protein